MATRANIESTLILDLGPRLAFVGLDGATNDGTNASLNDPIRSAVQAMGYTVTAYTVADSDLAVFAGFALEKLLDLCKLETLNRTARRCTDVNVKAGVTEQQLVQFHQQVMEDIAVITDRLSRPYGPYLPAPAIGTMQSQGLANQPVYPNDPMLPYASRSRFGRWPYP